MRLPAYGVSVYPNWCVVSRSPNYQIVPIWLIPSETCVQGIMVVVFNFVYWDSKDVACMINQLSWFPASKSHRGNQGFWKQGKKCSSLVLLGYLSVKHYTEYMYQTFFSCYLSPGLSLQVMQTRQVRKRPLREHVHNNSWVGIPPDTLWRSSSFAPN